MAVTWAAVVTLTDAATKAITVVATRTDDALPPATGVRTYTIDGVYDVVTNTPEELLQIVANGVWDKYQLEAGKESQLATIKARAEAALKAELESREP